MYRFVIALICLLLLSRFTLDAQTAWTRLAPTPQEHTLNDIKMIPGSNKIIAVGEGSTVMLSDDGGASWELVLNPAGMNNDYQAKGVHFINESTGFINGGWETILKTIDGGYTWELKQMSSTVFEWKSINDLAFVDETTGFAVGDEGQLFKTTDGGETWPPIASGVSFNLTDIEFADSSTGFIFGGHPSFMLKTTDGGDTWTLINCPAGLTGCSEMYFISASEGFASTNSGSPYFESRILKTIDTGMSWYEVSNDPFIYNCKFTFFDDLHGVAGSVAPAYSTRILITSDKGETWTGITPPEMPWFSTNSMCATDPNTAFTVGALGMIYKTSNQGADWEAVYNQTFWRDIYDVQFISNQVGFVMAQGFGGGVPVSWLKKTMDGGVSWQTVAGGSFNYGVLHYLSPDTGFIVEGDYGQTLHRTTDGGITWIHIPTGFEFQPVRIEFADYFHGIIAGEYTLIRTIDGGDSWNEVNTGTYGSYLDIDYRSADTVFVSGISSGGTLVIKSVNGGDTWEIMEPGDYGPARDIFFANDQTAFLACNNAILKSTDGGSGWSAVICNNLNPIEFRSIFFPSPDTGYAVGKGLYENMLKTVDGGETWEVIPSGITSGINFVHFMNDYTGLIFGENGIEAKTTDGGVLGLPYPAMPVEKGVFTVYPNPASDRLFIRLNTGQKADDLVLSISDMQGRQVYYMPLDNRLLEWPIPVGYLPAGVYTLQLKSPQGLVASEKLIKM